MNRWLQLHFNLEVFGSYILLFIDLLNQITKRNIVKCLYSADSVCPHIFIDLQVVELESLRTPIILFAVHTKQDIFQMQIQSFDNFNKRKLLHYF